MRFSHDYFKVTDDKNNYVTRDCGQSTGKEMFVGGKEALITFHSDGDYQNRGFMLLFTFIHPSKWFCKNWVQQNHNNSSNQISTQLIHLKYFGHWENLIILWSFLLLHNKRTKDFRRGVGARKLGSCCVDRAWITEMEVNNFLLHFYRFGWCSKMLSNKTAIVQTWPSCFRSFFFNLAVKKCFWRWISRENIRKQFGQIALKQEQTSR